MRSLANLARLEICKANAEREEVEKTFDLVYSSQKKKKKKKITKFCREKAFLQKVLAKSREDANQRLLKIKLLKEKRESLRDL